MWVNLALLLLNSMPTPIVALSYLCPLQPKDLEPITEDDYFSKNPEFATWLLEERRQFFSSLSTEESRSLFTEFVEAWNKGRLGAKYYNGIKALSAPRTNHNWAFKRQAQQVDAEGRRRSFQDISLIADSCAVPVHPHP